MSRKSSIFFVNEAETGFLDPNPTSVLIVLIIFPTHTVCAMDMNHLVCSLLKIKVLHDAIEEPFFA